MGSWIRYRTQSLLGAGMAEGFTSGMVILALRSGGLSGQILRFVGIQVFGSDLFV